MVDLSGIDSIVIDFDINNAEGVDSSVFAGLKHSAEELIGEKHMASVRDWMDLVKRLISLVEDYNYLKGGEKKLAVVRVVESLISEKKFEVDVGSQILFFSETVLHDLIDTLVATWRQRPLHWTCCRLLSRITC